MITNSRTQKGLQAKLEGENYNQTIESNLFKASTSAPSTSRQWGAGGLRNPRIVRVSRSFGGKDRHSKVCTVRGLRDRRIRLSVPTAIQLYDLQDRLGVSQPSKVIDWLLDATKDDIDELPPLQIPQGFGSGHHQFHHQIFNLPPPRPPHDLPDDQPRSLASLFNENPSTNFIIKDNIVCAAQNQTLGVLKEKGKELFERGTHMNEAENQDGNVGIENFGGQLFGQKFFPLSSNSISSSTSTHNSSLPGIMLNNSMAYNYYHRSDQPSNLSLSQFGSHGFASQIDSHPSNVSSYSTSSAVPLPLASGGPSQLFFCPPPTQPQPPPQPLFCPYPTPYLTSFGSQVESDHNPKQINHFQLLRSTSSASTSHHLLPSNSLMPSLHSSSLPFKSFQTFSNPRQLRSHNNNDDERQPAEKGS